VLLNFIHWTFLYLYLCFFLKMWAYPCIQHDTGDHCLGRRQLRTPLCMLCMVCLKKIIEEPCVVAAKINRDSRLQNSFRIPLRTKVELHFYERWTKSLHPPGSSRWDCLAEEVSPLVYHEVTGHRFTEFCRIVLIISCRVCICDCDRQGDAKSKPVHFATWSFRLVAGKILSLANCEVNLSHDRHNDH